MKVLFYIATVIGLVYSQDQCSSGSNCALPDCRCFSDTGIPGGLQKDEVPQMVVVTMDYSLNSEYQELYDQLFVTTNPNDCPTVGTFFLQDKDTNYDIVKSYYDKGFEIGVSSLDGSIPGDVTTWVSMIKSVKEKITAAGVKPEDIRGYRAPQLNFGGTDEFIGDISLSRAEMHLLLFVSCFQNQTQDLCTLYIVFYDVLDKLWDKALFGQGEICYSKILY